MKIFLILIFVGISNILLAQSEGNWFRSIEISPDGTQILFTHKGDLYKIASSGGLAQQLTFHEAHDHKPVWSKDGNKIAFASDRYGNFDIYIMDAEGGAAERLTYHSNNEEPYTFSNDNNLVYFGALRQDDVQHRQYPHRSQSELYSVPSEGGKVDMVFTFPAEEISINNSATQFLYHDKKGGENYWRKHQNSSITRDIWLYDVASDKHTMVTDTDREARSPVYIDEENFFYLGEQSGSFNIYKKNLSDASAITKLTDFSVHPVRFLSYGSGTICFGYHGDIYTMQEGSDPIKLSVEIKTQDISNNDKYISINGGVNDMSVSPNGKEIAFIARGEVFVTSVEESYTKRITNTPEQERFVTWGPDGKSVVYCSERDGKWSIYKTEKARKEEPFFYASTLIKETPVLENAKENYLPKYSPDGKSLAYIEGRRTLKILNLVTKQEVTLLTPDDLFHMRDGDKYFTWSPDSKWLLIDWSKSLSNSEVLLMAADGSKKVNLNDSGYYDNSPKWVNDGQQMIWFSNRDGLKSFATSGQSEYDVYSMFFTQESWDKFNLSKEDFKLEKEIKEELEKSEKGDKKDEKKKDKKADKKKEIKPLAFDWENMKDRTKRLTIHSSRLGDAVLSKGGDTLYYLSRFEDKMNLWSTNLRTKETKMVLKLGANFGRLEWDKKMKNLFLLSNGKISKIDINKEKKEAVKISGEMEYDAAAERVAMYNHVWIRTNAIFYHPDFHGIDWNLMNKEYAPIVSNLGNSYELTELLSEMLGELNVSHAGASYTGNKLDNADATASLGIFMNYNYEGTGILIDEVILGGPLDKAKYNIKAGMIIEKIDGTEISNTVDIAKYLNRKAGKFTLLELLDPTTRKRMTITVKPITLRQENRLLYKRWVRINEKAVEKLSQGQLGYVHIPGMGDGPYRSIYKDMMGKNYEKKAMIIDTRFNGGGDLVADLAMFFTGVPFITYATEAKVVGGEPTSRWTKPTLALLNESMYSDGHCFACGYTDLKIGKTIGMPVPGTCSFAGWERLPDGSVWGVVPVSAKDKAGNWMENNQTEPTIKIKNMPGYIDKGVDQQLEKAIEVLLKDVGVEE
jgi:Tol biopolymer transport system component